MVTGLPVIAAPPRKYEAELASPSTGTTPGVTYFWPAGTTNRLSSAPPTVTPNFAISLIVM